MIKITKATIASLLGQQVRLAGPEDLVLTGMQSVQEASETDLVWIRPGVKNAGELVNTTKARGIICDENTQQLFTGDPKRTLFVITADPKTAFVTFVKYINDQQTEKTGPMIHPTALIDPGCVLGANVRVGAYCVIGACRIGDNTVIGDHVKIHDPVTIGRNCVIREFCSIGGAGFGYLKNAEGRNEHIPHIGTVWIDDFVEIFPYANVDRGTLGKTSIGKGTVIDHYSHIGHNTTTGSDTIIAAGTVMAGGSKIGNGCFIGVHTVLKEKCEIGSNVLTGMGAVVVKNIPDNEIWVGSPARFLKPRE